MPLLSIIIPTHNRSRYAISSIKSILAASSQIEVVVCDSSEVDLISPEFADSSDLCRIRFAKTDSKSSVVDNFNKALTYATGEYLVFLGDDDFVSSKIIDVALWAKCHFVDAIKFTFPVLYYWEDFSSNTRWRADGSTLCIGSFSGLVEKCNPKDALFEAMDNFGGGVLDMPRAYAGMISRELANSICEKYGHLFGGVSPDIYSAALISLEAKKCVRIDYPIVVPGASGGSGSGLSAKGGHIGGLLDNPYMAAFKNLVWDAMIPEFYSVYTVWAYSLLKAVEVHPDYSNKLNYCRLYLKCLLYEKGYSRFTFKSMYSYLGRDGLVSFLYQMLTAILSEGTVVLKKIWNRYSPLKSDKAAFVLTNLNDTWCGYQALEEYLSNNTQVISLDSI